MRRAYSIQSRRGSKSHAAQGVRAVRSQRSRQSTLPAAAYRQRGVGGSGFAEAFNAPELWHAPQGREEIKFVVQPAGEGYLHPVTVDEVRERIAALPRRYRSGIEVVQFSRMTRKQALFPRYGMQWGPNVYLYPIEDSLTEVYVRPPRPQQAIEARMYGGEWVEENGLWLLKWTKETIRDFYLNNVLIHEIGHVHDTRNTSFEAREQFANWFAVEYGYRASRGRR